MAESSLAKLPIPARFGVGLFVMALVGAAYYVVMYSETADRIEREKIRRSRLKADLEAAKQNEIQYGKDLEELARRREQARELNKVLPEQTEYPAFLSSVQSVAQASDVELDSWSPQGEVQKEYYSKVPMQISLKGQYHEVAKFFYGIGQNDRIMNFENISLKPEKNYTDEGVLLVKGTVTAFKGREDSPKATPRRRKR